MSVVTVVATVEAGNVPPRVRLNVTDTGSSPALFSTTVTRLNPDGSVVPVRTQDGNPLPLTTSGSNRVGLIYDYEMPYGQIVTYSTEETPTSSSAGVLVPAAQVWLIHPGVPALSMPIRLGRGSFTKRTRAVNRGVFRPMGRSTAVVQTDGARKAPSSTLVVYVGDEAGRQALEDLTADVGTLLLNVPAQLGYNFPTCYISVGDMDDATVTEMVMHHDGYVSMPFDVVDMPIGGSQSERTYTDLIAAFATYADLKRAYNTYADVLAGP